MGKVNVFGSVTVISPFFNCASFLRKVLFNAVPNVRLVNISLFSIRITNATHFSCSYWKSSIMYFLLDFIRFFLYGPVAHYVLHWKLVFIIDLRKRQFIDEMLDILERFLSRACHLDFMWKDYLWTWLVFQCWYFHSVS